MQISCTCCGPRDYSEFTFGGDATKVRPADTAPQADWLDYVYQRENPLGLHREYWQHTSGCRQWLIVERNTLTHEIASVEAIGPFFQDGDKPEDEQ